MAIDYEYATTIDDAYAMGRAIPSAGPISAPGMAHAPTAAAMPAWAAAATAIPVGQAVRSSLPTALVPTPTGAYRLHRKLSKVAVEPGRPLRPTPIPIPVPRLRGSRILIWKQDPTVAEIGVRKAFLPGVILTGPRDARVGVQGLPPVSPNVFGDFIQTPGTDAFDAVHTFGVVRQTLTLYQRLRHPNPISWQWNSPTNTDPLGVYPHHSQMMNAFYSRTQKMLAFGFFQKPGSPAGSPRIFTCRSFDIASHETGHAILDGLKPRWILFGAPPQTGALHEFFGDWTAVTLALSQLDQVEAVIAQTKANLHDKTFLADLAEQFGDALGRSNGLRNADNDFKLSEVGNEVHALSQVMTGALYDILADVFAFERRPAQKDDAALLHEVGQYVSSLLFRAILRAPDSNATFADVANQMLQLTADDGKPVQYRNFIRNRFHVREVVVSPAPLTEDLTEAIALAPGIQDAPGAPQDRSACCGTMQLDEYSDAEAFVQAERDAIVKFLKEEKKAAREKEKAA